MKGWLAAAAAASVAVSACTTAPSATRAPVDAAPSVAESFRHREWADAVIYFVIVDRFADGDPATNVEVDPAQAGYFHGGDLLGLTQKLDEIADLGVTALWITPVVKNIDGFVTGAGFPDCGYHGYWADDFSRLDRRFGTEAELEALVAACHAPRHPVAAGRGLQPRRLRIALRRGSPVPALGAGVRRVR